MSVALPQGISYEAACANFWVLDAEGLVTIKRPTPLSETVKPFARKTQEDVEGNSLVETVRQVSWFTAAQLAQQAF